MSLGSSDIQARHAHELRNKPIDGLVLKELVQASLTWLRTNQAMVNAATGTKPVIFGDFGKYYVRKVGSPVIGVRREYYWPNIGMAGIVRLDGDLIQSGAVKHLVMA